MKKLKHISKFALEGKISQKHAEEIDEMIENKLKAQRQEIIEMIEKMGSPINSADELKRADILIEVIKKIETLTKP